MAGNQEILGADEYLHIDSAPSIITVGQPFTITGRLTGEVRSNEIQLEIDGHLVQTVNNINNTFSITYTLTEKTNDVVHIKVLGVLNYGIRCAGEMDIPVIFKSLAYSLYSVYDLFKGIVENHLYMDVEMYDPNTHTGDGFTSLIDKVKKA